MIQRKVPLAESFAVGKTGLLQRFVYSCFDERYFTTVGPRLESMGSEGERYPVVGHQERLEKLLRSLMRFALIRAPEGPTTSLCASAPDQNWVHADFSESVTSLHEDRVNIFDNLRSS